MPLFSGTLVFINIYLSWSYTECNEKIIMYKHKYISENVGIQNYLFLWQTQWNADRASTTLLYILIVEPVQRQCFSDLIFDSETSEWTLHQVLTRTDLYPLVVFMVFATLEQKCITAAPGKVLKITWVFWPHFRHAHLYSTIPANIIVF